MSGFNSLYYAFSPAVADMQRENPAFRDSVRALIAPMIHFALNNVAGRRKL